MDSAFDGEEALICLKQYQYDAVILDIMMPKINGLEVLGRARANGIQTPVIMLTAKSTIDDKITGLDLGADDYLSKPFSTEELLARLRALIRRKSIPIQDSKEIKYGDLLINKNNYSVTCNNKTIVLSNKEMHILSLLIENKGGIVSVENITKNAWDIESYSTSENVWVFISYLRKKLDSIDSKVLIKSIRYQGYYLEIKND